MEGAIKGEFCKCLDTYQLSKIMSHSKEEEIKVEFRYM